MIRIFGYFCKQNILNYSKMSLNECLNELIPCGRPCPSCKTNYPNWKKHATYFRYLIFVENTAKITEQITITRYKCKSCNRTHALLPDLIIPYSSYSLGFVILVIEEYFNKNLTVAEICSKYDISESTLYCWKEIFLKHKKIWLGLLDDRLITSIQFLYTFIGENQFLNSVEFFQIAGISFMQSQFHRKTSYYSRV
jgi:hypothetical protein